MTLEGLLDYYECTVTSISRLQLLHIKLPWTLPCPEDCSSQCPPEDQGHPTIQNTHADGPEGADSLQAAQELKGRLMKVPCSPGSCSKAHQTDMALLRLPQTWCVQHVSVLWALLPHLLLPAWGPMGPQTCIPRGPRAQEGCSLSEDITKQHAASCHLMWPLVYRRLPDWHVKCPTG